MAIREYIGARYVPRFMGPYDNTQIYDALDVVDNGMGTSYIAKKTVPANTPLTNTEYWFVYGASSGAILNLQQQIDDMQDGSISGSLQDQINDMNDPEIPTSLKHEINYIYNTTMMEIPSRGWLFLGDSYDTINGDGNSWIDKCADYLSIPQNKYVKRSLGGTGFAPPDASKSFVNFLSANPVPDPDMITDIVICSGANDTNSSSWEAVKAGMQAFDIYVRGIYPNLRNIYIGFIGWVQSVTYRNYCINGARAYYTGALANRWHYLSGVENILKNTALILDGISDYAHPNPTGVGFLAMGIANALATGYSPTYYERGVSYTANTSKITVVSGDISSQERIKNDMISVQFNLLRLQAADDLSGIFEIASCDPLATSMNMNRYIPVFIYNISNGKLYPGKLFSENAGVLKLWFDYNYTFSNGTDFAVYSGVYTDIIH